MKLTRKISAILPLAFLALLLISVYFIYSPGARGGFLFDDYSNLDQLGVYGGVKNFDTFKSFVFQGVASPLGRPLALATFLLDDYTWPSNSESFKYTNIKIHMLVGLLLCWATLNLMRLFGRKESEAIWIALLSSAIWMLHPYMVSTTLYVVQRMAQLAALFVLAGISGYLHGRLLMLNGEKKSAYLWMSCSILIATPLALLSKENGILLPLLLIVVEFCLPKNLPKISLFWSAIFLWLPASAIAAKLFQEINFSHDAWPNRSFTQPERLLTEPRILCEYLYNLYVPRIEGRGLFQDGYIISTDFLHPVSTIASLLFLISFFCLAIFYHKKYPTFSVGILFYFVGHVLESTLLGLELYFEHRNYLPSVFLFLPIAVLLVDLGVNNKLWVAVVGTTSLLILIGALTWQRTNLWSNTSKLELYWAASTPESPRAQNKIGSALLSHGNIDAAIEYMDKAAQHFPKNGLLTIHSLIIKVYVQRATEVDFHKAANALHLQPFDAQAVVSIRDLVDKVTSSPVDNDYCNYTLKFIDQLEYGVEDKRVTNYTKLFHFLKGKLHLALNEDGLAYEEYSLAIQQYGDTDAALSMVAEVINANRPVEALMLFKQAEILFKQQPDKTLKRSRAVYKMEFVRMKNIIDQSLQQIGVDGVVEK